MDFIVSFIGALFTDKVFIMVLVIATTNFLFRKFFGDLTSKCPKCGVTYKDKNYYRIRGAVASWMGLVITVPYSKDSFEFLMGAAVILLGILVQFKKVEPHVCSSDGFDMEAAKSDSTS